jgi:cation diffusion facilitator family transporter
MQQKERYHKAKVTTLIGAFITTLLGLIKLMGGLVFHSHALVADGIHSFSDLLIDGMVLFASKYGSQDADASHPYGHQRIETAATLILALMLILAGTGIAWDSLDEIINQKQQTPGILALPIALLSILLNEGLFHYTHHIGKLIHSELVIANAWHHRSDAASSIIVLVGLIGSIAGYRFLDPIAAILVGLLIIKMGWTYGWNSVKELVDTAVEPEMLVEIQNIINQIHGVKKIHQLRSRLMGKDVFIDVHILVEPFISVTEGHYIAQHVHHALVKKLLHVKDVTVHVDPEDDETSCPSFELPNRTILEKNLLKPWQKDYPGIESWILHYFEGKLIIDLVCTPAFDQWHELKSHFDPELLKQFNIANVRCSLQLV